MDVILGDQTDPSAASAVGRQVCACHEGLARVDQVLDPAGDVIRVADLSERR
jgi:hypothetical protein